MRAPVRTVVALVAAAALVGCATAAGGHRPLTNRLDAALARAVHRTGSPGATAAVVSNGRLIWTGASGRARPGPNGRMKPRSLVPIASATKTVTATMVMSLVQRGTLHLGEKLDRTLPRLPAANRITLKTLLNHSSGLVDYFSDGAVDRIIRRQPYHRWTRPQVLAHVTHVRFAPGSHHSYSNSNYVTLGGVLHRATGESVQHLFRRFVGRPLHLHDSTFRYGGAPQSQFAHPLAVTRHGYRDSIGAHRPMTTDYWGETWTDGGLATTAADLARIGNAVYAGRLLSSRTVAEMLPPRPGGWGLGTFDMRALGRRWFGHDGLYGGFQTENWTDRRRGVTVVAFANRAGGRTVSPRIWRAVAAAYGRGG